MEVTGDLETMIAGLACGVPSSFAWPILSEHVAVFVSVDDSLAGNVMRLLQKHDIEAGECGGAAAGFLEYLMQSTCAASAALREVLALGSDSRVLIINIEGATDTKNYKLQLSLPHLNPMEHPGLLSFQLGPSCARSQEREQNGKRLRIG